MTIDDIIDGPAPFKTPKNPIQRIKVIGVGGGGNNAVNHMHKKGIKDVSFVLLNTDRQVLEASPVPTKVLIGPGRGAGGQPERARKYAEECAEQISDLFDDMTDMVFITAGMGGGTGTGAGPVVARIAKERGILTVGIVTVPFLFEGQQKILKALEGAREMAKNVDSLLIINNQRLKDIYKHMDILNAFAKADDTLLNAAQSITDIITQQGLINRDFNDVDTTLREGGTAIISTGYGEGPQRVTEAIQDALHSPLLRDTNIFSSKKLLLILYISDDSEKHPFNMDEIGALDEFVERIDHGNIDVMWGLYQQPGLDDRVKITILASGFEKMYDSQDKQENPEPGPTKIKKDIGSDKSIKETYGVGKKPMTGGQIISPDDYDNPECDTIREFEQRPAIDRNPYKKFMGNVGSSSLMSDVSSDEKSKSEMDALNVKPSSDSKGENTPKGNITIDFGDLN